MEGGSSSRVVDIMAGLNLGTGGAGPSALHPSAGDGALPFSSAAAAAPAAAGSSGSSAPGAGVVIGPNCQLCDKEVAGPPKLCGACGTVGYCSKECQKADWKVHKHLCEPSRLWRAALATGGPPPSRAKAESLTDGEGFIVAYRMTGDEVAGLKEAQRTVLSAADKELEAIICMGLNDMDAIPRLKALLSTLKDAVGRDHVANLPVLTHLSTAFNFHEMHDDAYQYCLRALTIFESRFGPSDPGIVDLLTDLINHQYNMTKYDEATIHVQRSLLINVLNEGPKSDAVVLSLELLAQCLSSSNRMGEARGLLRLALAIKTQLFGLDDERLVPSLLYLAFSYIESAESDDFATAEPLVKDALAKIERGMRAGDAEFDFKSARAHHLYARCLAHRGDYAAAVEHEQLNVDLTISAFGGSHVKVGTSLIQLAHSQIQMERWAEAEINLRQGAQILTDHDNPEHDEFVAYVLQNADTCRANVAELARRRARRNRRA